MFMFQMGDIKPGLLFLAFYTRICGHNFMIFKPFSPVFKFPTLPLADWLNGMQLFDWVTKVIYDLKTNESATQKLIKQLGSDTKPIVKQRNIFTEKMY